jgi:hypothetical protein
MIIRKQKKVVFLGTCLNVVSFVINPIWCEVNWLVYPAEL